MPLLLGREAGQRLGVDVGRPDLGAFARQAQRRGAADPLTGRCDDGGLAVEPSGHGLLSLILFKLEAFTSA